MNKICLSDSKLIPINNGNLKIFFIFVKHSNLKCKTMLRKSLKFALIITLLLTFITACKNNKHKTDTQTQNTETTDTTKQTIDQTVLIKFKNKVFGIPSPVLVSSFVKKLDLPYQPDLVNPVSNATKYLTTFKQAVNIGVYSADLAYLNIYGQVNQFGDYFNIIKQLADNLDLLNTIDQKTLQSIENNTENADSLMYLISKALRDIDAYLTNNDQQKIGALILAGGWVESVFFLTELYKTDPNEELLLKIGEQKSPLNNLLHILEPYYGQGDKNIDKLFESLSEISSVYDAIEITYEYKQPEVYPDQHLTIINSTTKVNIDDLDLQKITGKISSLRNWLVN